MSLALSRRELHCTEVHISYEYIQSKKSLAHEIDSCKEQEKEEEE